MLSLSVYNRVIVIIFLCFCAMFAVAKFGFVTEAGNQPQEPTMFDPLATIIVNDTTDTIHSPGCATTGTGTCSLRDAILFTNAATAAAGGTNTITLGAGTFNLSITGSGENAAATGDLDILAPPTGFTNTININGAGVSSTIVQWSAAVPAASRDRIIDAHPNAPPNGSITLSISGITFTGGNSVTSSGGVMLTGRPGDITNLTNSVFDNNTAFTNGGVISQSSSAATHDLNITNCVFSNNLAGGGGGAVSYNGLGTVTITGSTFSNNRTGPVGANTGGSGGALSTSGGGNGGTYNVSRNVFINNQVLNATAQGGAVINTNGTLNISFNRFIGNTVPAAANGITLAQTGGATVNVINANDNWWGQNSGPVANDAVVLAAGGTINLTTWLQLRNTPTATSIVTGQTTTISADILGRNSGGPISAANLVGLPTFPATSSTIFSLPVRGNLSATNGQFVNGIANLTPTFTATSAGAGSTSATADNQTVAGPITINKANTTVSLGTSGSPSVFGQSVTFTATVTVNSPGNGAPTGNITFKDNNVNIGTCLSQAVSGGVATCTLNTLNAGTHPITAVYNGDADFNISPASPILNQVVNQASTTTSVTSDTPDPSNVGQSVTVGYSVSVTTPGTGTPSGNVQVSDGVNTCIGTVAAGSCSVSLNTAGNRTLTATYQGDSNFAASPASPGVSHVVGTVTWTGATSTNYATGSNWNTGLAPGSGDSVTIPSGATNQPSITTASFSASTLTVASGRTLTVTSPHTLTVSGVLTNNGTIGGTGTIANNFSNAGTVAPGLSPGVLNITGTFANTGNLNIEIGGTAGAGVSPNGHDQLAVSGTATLGGTLTVSLTNGFSPAPSQSFVIFDAASSTGTFGTVFLPNITPNTWTVQYNNAAGTVRLDVNPPTASGVTVSGRLLTTGGRGVRGAVVVITDQNGVSRTTTPSSLGMYRFDEVESGQTYVITVRSRRFTFSPRVIAVNDNISDFDIVADN